MIIKLNNKVNDNMIIIISTITRDVLLGKNSNSSKAHGLGEVTKNRGNDNKKHKDRLQQ